MFVNSSFFGCFFLTFRIWIIRQNFCVVMLTLIPIWIRICLVSLSTSPENPPLKCCPLSLSLYTDTHTQLYISIVLAIKTAYINLDVHNYQYNTCVEYHYSRPCKPVLEILDDCHMEIHTKCTCLNYVEGCGCRHKWWNLF